VQTSLIVATAGNLSDGTGYFLTTFTRGLKLFELSNHLGNVLLTVTDKKIAVDAANDGVADSYAADVVTAQDYYPGGSAEPGRQFTAGTQYRYGFNGKEKDNDVEGSGNFYDYGLRGYDPRIVRFWSVDPLASQYPFYSPYEYAGNNPIKFVDLDGAETHEDVSRFWSGQPIINISQAPAKGYNTFGVPRNAIWFFRQQFAAKPEMFSEANKLKIFAPKNPTNPTVDAAWVKFNPTAAEYIGQTLIHHHIDGGEMVAAIPKGLNNDFFSELHPYVNAGKALKGAKVGGLAEGIVNVLGSFSMVSGAFSGDPDAWINAFGYGEPHIGDIKKDWGGTNLYIQIMSIVEHYIPVLDANGKSVIDAQTGKPKYRLGSKTVTANNYTDYFWNSDAGKFEGINKVGSETEEWKYDEKGNRIPEKQHNYGTLDGKPLEG